MTYMEALEVLGCHSQPSKAEIKSAYRRRARVCHPDAGGNHDDFIRLQEAYNIAQNPPEQTQNTFQESSYRYEKEWTWMEDWFESRYPQNDDTLFYTCLIISLILGIFGMCWLALQPGILWEMYRVISILQGPVGITLGLAALGYIVSKAFLNMV